MPKQQYFKYDISYFIDEEGDPKWIDNTEFFPFLTPQNQYRLWMELMIELYILHDRGLLK
jgi:hypothetical protein